MKVYLLLLLGKSLESLQVLTELQENIKSEQEFLQEKMEKNKSLSK